MEWLCTIYQVDESYVYKLRKDAHQRGYYPWKGWENIPRWESAELDEVGTGIWSGEQKAMMRKYNEEQDRLAKEVANRDAAKHKGGRGRKKPELVPSGGVLKATGS